MIFIKTSNVYWCVQGVFMQKKDVVVGIQSNRVVAIDYLKGFSIFTIVLMHLLNTIGKSLRASGL